MDALAAIYKRNAFYRRMQHHLAVVFLLSIITNILLMAVAVYQHRNPPAPRYFPISINGKILPLYPLDQPNQTDDSVISWATEAAVAAFSYSYVNYREELQASSGFFTADGWKLFLRALEDSNNLEAVKEKRFVVSARVVGVPKVLDKGFLGERYTWRIQIPLQVTYQNADEYTQQYNLVTLLVTRESTLNAPRGIGIAQFVVRPLAEAPAPTTP